MPETTPCVGIDLGTTASALGYVRDGQPRLVPVDGDPLLPSVVSWPEEGPPLVGTPALNRMPIAPAETVRASKRRIGSDHRYPIRDLEVRPQDVAAQILRRLVDACEEQEGFRPDRAVITVPARFTQPQRAATKEAGELAGLHVERLINEPTAAALAHSHGQPQRRTALVYDLGGGTFDASVIRQDGDIVEVLASDGDVDLGGDDFDRILLDQVVAGLADGDPGAHEALRGSAGARARLLRAVEQAKIDLSTALTAPVRMPFAAEAGGRPIHVDASIDRDQLLAAIEPLLQRTLGMVDRALSSARLGVRDLDDVLLVGGSSLIPRVWDLLRSHCGTEPSAAIPPRDAVALGAAIQAAIIDGASVEGVLIDVAPWSLSVSHLDEYQERFLCKVITPRNAPLPSRHTERFFTVHPNQPALRLFVFQGADRNPSRNTILGTLLLEGLPPAPSGTHQREIACEIRHDLDGIATIEARDVLAGLTASVRLASDGDEAASLREEFDEHAGAGGFAMGPAEQVGAESGPGTGKEQGWDARGLPELGSASEDEQEQPGPHTIPLDPSEARATLAAVGTRMESIRSKHPGRAAEVEALLERGRAALLAKPPEVDEASRVHDELADLLFELGIWL